jgi:hypothetical protein
MAITDRALGAGFPVSTAVRPPAGAVGESPLKGDSITPSASMTREHRLTQAARDGEMEAWLEILSQRHPELVWVPKQELDQKATRS